MSGGNVIDAELRFLVRRVNRVSDEIYNNTVRDEKTWPCSMCGSLVREWAMGPEGNIICAVCWSDL